MSAGMGRAVAARWPGAARQRGAAILVAMLVLSLVAALAASLQWRQWKVLQEVRASRFQAQSAWLLVGALDWARLILREDARAQLLSTEAAVDHLGRAWAVPLQEARLDTFLRQGASQGSSAALAGEEWQREAQEVYLSGRIADAQGKINLTNLVNHTQLHGPTLEALRRLYDALGLPHSELQQWVRSWVRSATAGALTDVASSFAASREAALAILPTQTDELVWLGVSAKSLALLQPHITILPRRTRLNVNTASALALAAQLGAEGVHGVQGVLAQRVRKPFGSVAELERALGYALPSGTVAELGVNTEFFEISARIRLWDWVVEEHSLVQRNGLDVTVVQRRRGALPH